MNRLYIRNLISINLVSTEHNQVRYSAQMRAFYYYQMKIIRTVCIFSVMYTSLTDYLT